MTNERYRRTVTNAKWRETDAFLCIVSLVFAYIIINCIYILIVSTHPSSRSPSMLLAIYSCCCVIALLITVSYSRIRTIEEFRNRFGFLRPDVHAAFGASLLGAALGVLACFLTKKGLGAPRNEMVDYFYSFGKAGIRYSALLVVLVPPIEEVILRGYFYSAFRRSYSKFASVGYVLGIATLTHFKAVSTSGVAASSLFTLNILVSLLRERTNSIWNCVLCHVMYNCVCAAVIS
jgi:membrane protease YdiL (CAAX protease family)